MRRVILVVGAVLAACQAGAELSPTPAPAPAIAVVPAPLEAVHPQAAPPPIVVDRPALRCPSGTSIGGALPPEGTEAWCQLENGKRHGPIVAFFPVGGKRMQGEYRDGAEHGVWQEYFDGGRLRSEKMYERGRPTGRWSTYHHEGTLASETVQVSDVEQHLTEFRPDGTRARAGAIRGGERHGMWQEWNEQGYAREVSYEKGERTVKRGRYGDEIGIPECDEYIEKYSQCIADKVPEAARESMEEAIAMSVKAWRDAASGPAKDGLATACKAALDAASIATRSMGCKW